MGDQVAWVRHANGRHLGLFLDDRWECWLKQTPENIERINAVQVELDIQSDAEFLSGKSALIDKADLPIAIERFYKMNQGQPVTLKSLIRCREVLQVMREELDSIKPVCKTCRYFTLDQCAKFDALPPDEFQITPEACQDWEMTR